MKRVLMMTMAAALLGGCAVKNQVTHSLQAIPLTAFQQSESNPNQRIYKEPGVDLRQYHRCCSIPCSSSARRTASGIC